MIPFAWVMQRLGLATSSERDVAGILAGVISVFETRTGSLWAFRESNELRIPVDPLRSSESLWIPAMNVSNLVLFESDTSATDAKAQDPIDGSEYEASQVGSAMEVVPIDRSWESIVVATFRCGYVDLPAEHAAVREAIVQQVQYELSRNRGENVAVASRFGRDTVGATYRDVDFVPSFRIAISANRVIEV